MKKSFLVVALTLLVSAFFTVGAFAEEAKKAEEPKKVVGNKVGEYFAIKDIANLDGTVFKGDSVIGKKKVAFVMVSPTCSLCKKEINDLEEVAKDKADKIYIVVAANAKAAERFTKDYKGPFKILIDAEFEYMEAANFRVTPSTILIDETGKIVEKFAQYKDGQALDLAKKL